MAYTAETRAAADARADPAAHQGKEKEEEDVVKESAAAAEEARLSVRAEVAEQRFGILELDGLAFDRLPVRRDGSVIL